MNYPKQIRNVPEDKRAIAPYNFVELPDRVVEAQVQCDGKLRENDRYFSNRNTGKIECTLTTSSPLYTRCAMSLENFQEYSEPPKNMTKEEKKEWEEKRKGILAPFFSYSADGLPVIPGSSLRGMLRTLVEIVSFSKIDRVSGQQRLFFRAVASNPKKESWGDEYKKYVRPSKIEAGYLKKDSQGWYIHPAKKVQGKTFVWVKENDVNLPDFKKFNDKCYKPQYVDASCVNNFYQDSNRFFTPKVNALQPSSNKGVLVTSGNMKQADEPSPRRNHCLVFEEDSTPTKYRIEERVIKDYLNALTDFQKEPPFTKEDGMLKQNRPAFYLPPEANSQNVLGFFGQSPNFRIPYSPNDDGHATTVVDFIPKELRKLDFIDIADAIFGWVKQESEEEKLPKDFQKERAGRVFITDALFQTAQNGIWYEKEPLTPKILSGPKPGYFPHYLVQKSADPKELLHYANKGETVIRGHKLYWHKDNNPNFKHPTPEDENIQSQITKIKPVNKEVTFKFDIHFENLTPVELGALMWVLDIAQDDAYRLKLGMGKPLGMGAVKIESKLFVSDRPQRYTTLFNGNNWETGETLEEKPDYHELFETYMLEKLQQTGEFKDIRRIDMLLKMLSWSGPQNTEAATRYMEIEREIKKGYILNAKPEESKTLKGDKVNEYTKRPVLPTPLDDIEVTLETARSSPPKKKTNDPQESRFSKGKIVDAEVIEIGGTKEIKKGKKTKKRKIITYQIEGSDCPSTEEVSENKNDLKLGATQKVIIKKVVGNSIKTVKRLESDTDRPTPN